MLYQLITAVMLFGYGTTVAQNMPSVMELVDTIGDKQIRSVGDLDDYTNELFELAQIHIAKSFSAETRRYKRALDLTSVRINGTENFGFTMANPSDFGEQQLAGVTKLRVLSLPGKEYWVLGYGLQDTHVVLEKTQNQNQLKAIARFTLKGEIAEVKWATASIFNETLWIAMASENELVSLVGVNLVSGVAGNHQVLVTEGPVGGLHMFTSAGNCYLAVGTNNSNCSRDGEINSRLCWPYFDWQDLGLRAKNVTDITGFNYYGNYYLVFSTINSEGTQVYRFNAKLMTLTLIQQLSNFDVYSVHHLYEAQDEKHYIVMSDGIHGKLYRWQNEQLLLWQELGKGMEVAPVGSIGSYRFSSLESVIMVAYGGKVALYADDVSGLFNLDFVMNTNCNSIGDLSMVKMSDAYVVTYICVDHSSNTVVKARRVTMEVIDLEEPEDAMDSIKECLDSLKDNMDSRKPSIDYLEEIVTTDLLMTTDHSQTWSNQCVCPLPVTISGTLISQETVIIGDGSAQLHEETYNQFVTKTNSLENNVDSVNSGMNNVLYHSKDQIITGPIAVTSLTADKFESNTTKLTESNGTPLLSLAEVFMIDGIDQQVSSSMYIDTMKTDAFSTRDGASSATVNGILTNQLMRKSLASQEVTGKFDYEDLNVQSIEGLTTNDQSLTINGIDTNTIVMKGKNASFLDKKTFESLTVLESVDIELLNEIDLSDLAEDLVFVNSFNTQILDGRFTLQDVTVDGNVDVSLINNVDMKELNNLVVKKSGDYSLSGDVTYQSNLGVTGTLTSPKLNGIDVSNIVDLQTDHIMGNYTFTNVNVDTAINSNNINGIDTNVDVVTIDADETVLGRLTFTDDVSVIGPEGVELVVLATINSIHPSTLKTIDDQGNLQINTNVTFNTTLHVSANVVLDVVNNLDMRGIEDRYWRKSTDQIVTVGPSIDSVTFEAPATAQSVNGHQMNDFLNVAGSQIIDGTYSFQSLVTIDGSLDMVDGKTISGVDVSALKNNLVTLADDQSIDALTSFSGEISASGNLMLSGKLNGWDLTSDLMRLDLSLPLTGSLTFVDKTTATSLKLSNSNLVVQSLNGLNVENAKADLVLVNEDASIAGSLKFTSSVSAKSLDVSGTVDNVDMGDLVSRSLKKNSATAQSVSGAISVNKGVDFGQNPSLGVVNGKDWTTHLAKVVPVNYNGVISGRKTFSQPLSISGNFNPTTLNGFDVAQLASRILTKGTNQNVAGKYTINGDITARNVNAPEIDGVGTANLVLVDQTSSVSGTVTFAESLETKDITSNSGILDGCDLIQLNTSTVWRAADGSIEIAFPVTLNSLSVGGDCTVNDAVKAGTQEVLNFLDTLVLKSSDQEISGEVEFITDITMKNLVAGTADGVDIDNLYDVTVLDNEDSVIDCDVAFTTHLSVQDLDVTSAVSGLGTEGVLIDHINVTDMNVNAVLLQGGSYLMTGAKTFTGGLTTSGLGIGGSLGGIPVTELVVVSSSSRLADDLIFRAATTVKGDLQVEGLIDNVDLGQLLVDRIKLDSAETLTSSTSFQGINVEGDLVVEEINGISLSDIVLKSGRNRHDITGEKNFAGGLHAKGEIQATVINGVNIHELNGKIVRKDRATTINTNMIFENTVEAKSAIDVVGAVNGYKLSDVNYPPSVLNQNIISKSNKLADLNKTLSDIFVDTKTLACGMYETILYGEILNVENVAFSGKMSFGNFGDTPFLVLRECDILCTCASHYYFYHVTSDLDLLQDFNDEYSAFIFDTEGFEGTGIVNNCTGDDEVKLLQITDSSHNVGNLGAIADVAVFVVNGVPYMVTAGTVAEASPGATTKIHVVKMVYPKPEVVWSMQTPYSASSVDVTSSDDGWLLLVANQMALNDPIDPFTAPSQLYLWSSTEEKFSLVEEYIGQHVISGIFLNAQYGPKESFFSLAQLQAASSPVFEDNVKYTTQVLVFKLGETGYRPYQSLPSYGVVAQESLSIGDDLYLLLLSDFTHTLDVYENRPSEGFRLHQKIPICSKPIDVKKIVVSFKEFILVSCKEPAQIMKIRFLSKGFTYKE